MKIVVRYLVSLVVVVMCPLAATTAATPPAKSSIALISKVILVVSRKEVGEARKQDPLVLLKEKILKRQLGSEADFKQVEKEVGELVRESITFADASPFPDPSSLHEDVYS